MKTRLASSATTVVLLAAFLTAVPLLSQTPLTETEAQAYVGTWDLTADINGNPIKMTLEIVPIAGEVKAALKAIMLPAPQLVDQITKIDPGIDLAVDVTMGGNAMRVHLKTTIEGEGLVGTFGDDSGFFSAPFTGERIDDANIVMAALDAAAEAESKPQSRRAGATTIASMSFEGRKVSVSYGTLELESPDHRAFVDTTAGEVYNYPGSRCFKLQTDANLVFGTATVAAHNFGPDYPGTYSLWLKKSADGMQLVFNQEADVWGSMHNPDADVSEIVLSAEKLTEPLDALKIEVLPADDGGLLRIAWGTDSWSAPFSVQ